MDDVDEDDLAIPLPVFSDEEVDDCREEPLPSGSVGERIKALLQAIVDKSGARYCPSLLDVEFWRGFGAEDGLHVNDLERLPQSICEASVSRRMLDERGYLQCGSRADAELTRRVNRGLQRLKATGFAPAFIYVFDETWLVIEAQWRLLGAVLAVDGDADPSEAVLEPSIGAHVLSRPSAACRDAEGASSEIQRHTPIGGAFSLPHRDHSSADCFDDRGHPTLLSLWVPVTDVTAENGCMFVVPKEADALFGQPAHAQHLSPHRSLDWGGAIALAPVAAGSTLAWHGSLVHWGGRCASYSEHEPRASLTAAVRRRGARGTALQAQQDTSLPELTLDDLPLPLSERVRYACGSVLLYSFWYGLQSGIVPEAAVAEWPEVD